MTSMPCERRVNETFCFFGLVDGFMSIIEGRFRRSSILPNTPQLELNPRIKFKHRWRC